MVSKISVVTACYNSEATIRGTILSVRNQDYWDFEHVLVDGLSKDSTLAIIGEEAHPALKVVSEADKGIYDAMNKGFYLATGDVVAFLNSDDVYFNSSVFSDVIKAFHESEADFVYGNLNIVDKDGVVLRSWKPGKISSRGLLGMQIPHPSLFVKRSILERITPPFDSSLKISADIKQQLIFINKFKCTGYYIDKPLTVMANGGASTNSLTSYFQGWKETKDSYNEIFGGGGTLFTIRKVLSKFRGVKNILRFFD